MNMSHSTMVLLIVGVLIYYALPTIRKLVLVIAIVVGLYYAANNRLPWSASQQKKVMTKTTNLFKD